MRVGFTCSSFDLLHAGHILMLKECKARCDYLIVGLQDDPTIDRPYKNKPIQTFQERYIQLEAVKYIDEIQVYNTEDELYLLLQHLPIDIRFMGEEYKDKPHFTGKDLNHKFIYNTRKHNWSSSNLRERIKQA